MMRLFVLFALLFGVLSSVRAQDVTPTQVAALEVNDVAAFAVSGDSSILFVASESDDTLLVYDFADPSSPTLRTTIALDGMPTALAAARNYALVAVSTPDNGDLLEVIAPDSFSEGGYGVVAFPDIPDNARQITVSPDNRWAGVVGEGWYSVLQLISSVDIIGYPTESISAPNATTLAVGMAYIAQDDPTQVVQLLLRANEPPRTARTLELDAPADSLALNARMTVGAAVVDGEVVLFDTATMRQLSVISQDGEDISAAQFIAREDGEWLAVLVQGSGDVLLYDVTSPTRAGDIGSISTGITPTQLLVHDNLLLVADDSQIRVFSVE
jgi:hypothetical protein